MFSKQEKKGIEELTQSSNTIGKGTTIEGNISTYGNIRIDGKLIGNVSTKSKLVLGSSAHIEGNILAQNAEIEGEVLGTVIVTELLTLKSNANIKGDITTAKAVVESGSSFHGACKIGEHRVKASENGKQAYKTSASTKQYT